MQNGQKNVLYSLWKACKFGYAMKFSNLFSPSIILKHRKEKHVDPEGNFLCRHCDKKYPSYKFMGQHMRDKHQRQPFECIGM